MDDAKDCSRCKTKKLVTEFSGKDRYCRPCRNEYARDYHKRRPDVIKRAKAKYIASRTPEQRAEINRSGNLRKFNLTIEQWGAIFIGQGGRCAICRTDVPTGHGWHVDHDHACCPEPGRSCGECVRAILCSECNTGLGKFRDNPVFLRAAALYLERA